MIYCEGLIAVLYKESFPANSILILSSSRRNICSYLAHLVEILREHIHLSLYSLQQPILHHRLAKLLLLLTHLIQTLLLPKRGLHLLTLQLTPIETIQPPMTLYLLYASLRSQTYHWSSGNQFVDEVCSLYTPSSWYVLLLDHVLFGENSISDLYSVIACVWALS